MNAYAELQVTSNFSFLRGASHPQELVLQAAVLGLSAIAITDRNSLAGVVRAHGAAKQAGIRLVVGARLDLTEDERALLVRRAGGDGVARGIVQRELGARFGAGDRHLLDAGVGSERDARGIAGDNPGDGEDQHRDPHQNDERGPQPLRKEADDRRHDRLYVVEGRRQPPALPS